MALITKYRQNPIRGQRTTCECCSRIEEGYLASVAFLDVQVGRVLDQVLPCMSNDTVVIFTSDHGYGIGERGHWGKGSLYEIDARVPLIVRDPHLERGSPTAL